MIKVNKKGITRIETAFLILFTFVLTAWFFTVFYGIKRDTRDTVRQGHLAELQRALFLYKNETNSYPITEGQGRCLDYKVASGLIGKDYLFKLPLDPAWPYETPIYFNSPALKDYAISPAKNFCFWYYSNGDKFYISYYMEGDKITGTKGINILHFD